MSFGIHKPLKVMNWCTSLSHVGNDKAMETGTRDGLWAPSYGPCAFLSTLSSTHAPEVTRTFGSHLAKLKFGFSPSPTQALVFPGGSAGKESTCNMRDLGLIPRLGRSPGAGKGYPIQYSGLENSMDCIVHGVAESDTTE